MHGLVGSMWCISWVLFQYSKKLFWTEGDRKSMLTVQFTCGVRVIQYNEYE